MSRQLGYSNGVPTENSLFGSVSTDFIYDDVQCHGNEEHIWDCPHSPSHNCGSGEGAGVICFNGQLSNSRLKIPLSNNEQNYHRADWVVQSI